jgi:replication-associated recombination protein RarA
LLEKISLEEFLAVGDISSTRPLWKPELKSSLEIVRNEKALTQLEQRSMLLLDEISFLTLSKAEQDEVQNVLEKKEILLLLC